MNPTSSRSRSKPHFFHYIKPYIVHFQNIEFSQEKYKIHQKIVNQKRVFHKTPSSQFCLIETFSSPNLFSLTLLTTCLLTLIDLTEGDSKKSSLGAFCFKVFILAFFSFLFFSFFFLFCFFCFVFLQSFQSIFLVQFMSIYACLAQTFFFFFKFLNVCK